MQTQTPMVEQDEDVLISQLLRSVSIFRWAALTWAVVGTALSREQLTRPLLAVVLLAVAGVFTAATGYLAATRPALLANRVLLASEVALGITLLLGDGIVYEQTRSQSLPWAWPAAGIIAIGICGGQRAGLITAALVGAASLLTELFMLDRSQFVAAFSKIGLWLLVGAIAGALTQRLRQAEREISLARTREEVARELHDGVLQTLAVIQRRSDDPELSRMAKSQESSLRRYLADSRISGLRLGEDAGGSPTLSHNLEASLRTVSAQGEELHDLQVQVIVTSDCPDRPALPDELITSIAGAAAEAITNAAKHGNARKVTIFAEPSERSKDTFGLFVSIKDDGIGFDTEEMVEGIGLSRSIRGRLEDHGGAVKVRSRPGRGCEVQLWV